MSRPITLSLNRPFDSIEIAAAAPPLPVAPAPPAGDNLTRAAVRCYGEALASIERNVFRLCAEKMGGSPQTLEPEFRSLHDKPTDAVLEHTRARVEAELQETGLRIQQHLAGAVEMKEVILVLTQTTASLRHSGDARESKIRGVAQGIQEAADTENVEEFRAALRSQVSQLTKIVEEIRDENQRMVTELEQEMQTYRRRLDEAKSLVETDPLTGLGNRRQLEGRLQQYTHSGAPYCLLLIDLDRFKRVNDQHGHPLGDELLRAFSARLRAEIDPEDTAVRWGGDEFLVLMHGTIAEVLARARRLHHNVRGEYSLSAGEVSARIQVDFSTGVAEHRHGESAAQLLARADALLIREKTG